ncbi:MAG: hypothetical protein GY805_32750 [Chloroflexi bacterium]|nr:hypothetical protein [Chloroflexota bacterium]
MKTMDGLLFNQAEFLALMSAVNASDIMGMDSDAIVPADNESHQKMVLSGLDELKERKIVEEKEGVMLFPPDLIGMAGAVSDPQLFTQVMCNEPGVGQRRFMFYQAYDFIVEFTLPEENMFRLARIPSMPAMLQRVHFLLSIKDSNTHQAAFIVQQDAFFQSNAAMGKNQEGLALEMLVNGGATQDEANLLLAAVKTTQLSGTITLLRTENGRVLDGRDLLSLKAIDSSWIFHQKEAGSPQLIAATVDRESFLTAVYQLQTDLIQTNQE